jgi:hypothetical protein
VRVAERQLVAQTAKIGMAKSDFFPKLTLNGSIGLESLSFDTLGNSGNDFYSFGSGIKWPIFHMGSIRNNIKVQKAGQEQALVAYEKAVLVVVQETRDALTAFQKEQQRMISLAAAATAARTAAELADNRYKNGLEDFETVLEAQRARPGSALKISSCRAKVPLLKFSLTSTKPSAAAGSKCSKSFSNIGNSRKLSSRASFSLSGWVKTDAVSALPSALSFV